MLTVLTIFGLIASAEESLGSIANIGGCHANPSATDSDQIMMLEKKWQITSLNSNNY